MKYESVTEGIFLSRPNRFIAHVMINGREEICHVKNTGRCRELLIPGARLILEYHPNAAKTGRKTCYDVIGVYKEHGGSRDETLLINIDSQAPNQAAWEWLQSDGFHALLPKDVTITQLCREVSYGNSRFDFSFFLNDRQAFMEVKGVTLEHHGIASFPDAPTERGVKHLDELAAASQKGFACYLLLAIQMKGITGFIPNMETHPEFGYALSRAKTAGVTLLAYDCLVGKDSMDIHSPISITLPSVCP